MITVGRPHPRWLCHHHGEWGEADEGREESKTDRNGKRGARRPLLLSGDRHDAPAEISQQAG